MKKETELYIISKYPISSALPEYAPDYQICSDALDLTIDVYEQIKQILG